MYVRSEEGDWYVQLPANNRWGFVLADDENTYDFPPCGEWEVVEEHNVPKEIQELLGWMLK